MKCVGSVIHIVVQGILPHRRADMISHELLKHAFHNVELVSVPTTH